MSEAKVFLITGASSGMGKTTAIDLIKKGHIVYGAARRIDRMRELEELGGYALKMNITDELSVKEVVDHIIKKHGRIDVLWNNAGFGLSGTLEETSISDAKYQFDVNIFGLARITQLVIPHMRERGSGTIINTSSMGGKVYTPLLGWYHATKHALEGMSDCLRVELKPFGINVVILEPGAIETEFGAVAFEDLVERSGHGPYKPMVDSYVNVMNKYYKPGSSSPTSVISKTIEKIIESPRPKTRYLVGKMAKPMVCLRNTFGDRAYDKVIDLMLK
ncbi:MAG: short-chain dehydrogenase/reductase [Halobacteriovorax sp.]|nr:short-chain dehydrogenase/reductase [Halobacteriovorax sp.]